MVLAMSGLLSELSKLGLSKIENIDIFGKDKEESEQEEKEAEKKIKITEEKDMVFDKTYKCVVCDRQFKNKTVMSGKAKLVSVDTDLRPKYQGIDCIKYDTVLCNHCGYGALTRFYGGLTPGQLKLVKENICANFTSIEFEGDTYSYDDAILRYKLCLANSVIKRAKTGERAYACLKLAWLNRGKAESLDETQPDYMEQLSQLQAEEQQYIESAYEGFKEAMSKETFPICGMDEGTYIYVTADLARRCKDYQMAVKLLSRILMSKNTPAKVKERARELNELVRKEVKEQSGEK